MAIAKVTINPERFKKVVGRSTDATARRTANAILRQAQANIHSFSVHSHPGRQLKDSGRVVKGSDGNWLVAFNHRAARIVHEGAKAHIIVPRGARVLYFHGKEAEDSRPVFRNVAHHPGVRHKNRYLVDAARSLGLTVRRSAALSRPPERLVTR